MSAGFHIKWHHEIAMHTLHNKGSDTNMARAQFLHEPRLICEMCTRFDTDSVHV